MAIVTRTSRGSSVTLQLPSAWTNPTNIYDGAYGSVPVTYAVSPSVGSPGSCTIVVGGRNLLAQKPFEEAVVNSITVTVRGYTGSISRWLAPTVAAYIGTTQIGVSNSGPGTQWTTVSAAYTFTLSNITIDQINDPNFGVGITFVRSGTTVSTVTLDYIDISVSYGTELWNELSLNS